MFYPFASEKDYEIFVKGGENALKRMKRDLIILVGLDVALLAGGIGGLLIFDYQFKKMEKTLNGIVNTAEEAIESLKESYNSVGDISVDLGKTTEVSRLGRLCYLPSKEGGGVLINTDPGKKETNIYKIPKDGGKINMNNQIFKASYSSDAKTITLERMV